MSLPKPIDSEFPVGADDQPERMRITELVNSLDIGGAERMVSNLAQGLQERGHAVNVVCLRGAGALANVLRESGIEV